MDPDHCVTEIAVQSPPLYTKYHQCLYRRFEAQILLLLSDDQAQQLGQELFRKAGPL